MIIFDFDGTIADTFAVVLNHLDQLEELKLKGVNTVDIAKYRTVGIKMLITDLKLSKFRVFMLLLKVRKLFKRYASEIDVIRELTPVLANLKASGINLGILTSNSKSNVTAFLAARGLSDYFDFVYSEFGLFSKAKKLEHLINKYALDKAKVYYVGDEVRDIEAAQTCGIKSVAVTWGYNTKDALLVKNPDFLVDNPQQFKELFIKS